VGTLQLNCSREHAVRCVSFNPRPKTTLNVIDAAAKMLAGGGGLRVYVTNTDLINTYPCRSLNECPVLRPATNTTRATAPAKNKVSPGTLIQRKLCIRSVFMNSLLRANQ
jgi:hypothetical protein